MCCLHCSQLKVPIGGLTPYPRDYKRDRASNVDVIMSPIGMATLLNVDANTSVAAAYNAAYKSTGYNGNAIIAGKIVSATSPACQAVHNQRHLVFTILGGDSWISVV